MIQVYNYLNRNTSQIPWILFFLNKKKIEISLVNKNFYSIKLFRTRRILIMCYKNSIIFFNYSLIIFNLVSNKIGTVFEVIFIRFLRSLVSLK